MLESNATERLLALTGPLVHILEAIVAHDLHHFGQVSAAQQIRTGRLHGGTGNQQHGDQADERRSRRHVWFALELEWSDHPCADTIVMELWMMRWRELLLYRRCTRVEDQNNNHNMAYAYAKYSNLRLCVERWVIGHHAPYANTRTHALELLISIQIKHEITLNSIYISTLRTCSKTEASWKIFWGGANVNDKLKTSSV